MRISLNWIKEYVAVDVPVDVLVKRLTMAGIEAEKVEKGGRDTVVEFEITPNRPDCLSMLGMAREISAALDVPLSLPKVKARTVPAKGCDVSVEATQACSRYIGTVIEGVRIKEASPDLKKKLETLGNRAISNIVDVTNFCLFETGQPLHAFDLDRLAGGKIIVRLARKGEKIVTLDGVERTLDPSVLVIADAEKPVALAGIMGGANSEVSLATKNILLESAAFDPVLIRRTARKLGLSSDSSYRFERGVVFDNVAFGAARAVDLILQEAGGRVTARRDVAAVRPARPKALTLSLEKMNAFLGGKFSEARTRRIFKALGFSCTAVKKGTLKITPPAFRPDVQRVEDLYEEAARIFGYDMIPSSFPLVKLTGLVSSPKRAQRLKLVDYLLSQGFNEVLTYSLISREAAEKADVLGRCAAGMTVLNPLSLEQEILRPHLLPSILQVVQTNVNRGQKDLAIFETGKTYPLNGEREALGLALCGCLRSDWRNPKQWPFDFYDLKGALERVFAQMKAAAPVFSVSAHPFLEEGQRADLSVGKAVLGCCGKVADHVLERFGVRADNVFFAQMDLEAFYALSSRAAAYTPLCDFPSILRDVSLAVSRSVTFDQIRAAVRAAGGELLTRIDFKEKYLGEKIPAGQKGLVFSLCYQSSQRTLTEEEIQAVHEGVCRNLEKHLGAVIR